VFVGEPASRRRRSSRITGEVVFAVQPVPALNGTPASDILDPARIRWRRYFGRRSSRIYRGELREYQRRAAAQCELGAGFPRETEAMSLTYREQLRG